MYHYTGMCMPSGYLELTLITVTLPTANGSWETGAAELELFDAPFAEGPAVTPR